MSEPMHPFGILMEFEVLAEATKKWEDAHAEFRQKADYIIVRLIHEALMNRMSIDRIAKASGFTTRRVRRLMRNHGFDPKQRLSVLAESAAKAVEANAKILEIEPREIDLLSPLAYLPIGEDLRQEFLERRNNDPERQ